MNKKQKITKLKKVFKQEEPKQKGNLFVSIRHPTELRRNLLQCSRDTIYCLQNYQRVLLIRQRKLKEMENFRMKLKELNLLLNKLDAYLPKDNIDLTEKIEEEIIPPEKPARIIKGKIIRKPARKEKSDLEKLDVMLSKIEQKIGSLK